MNKETVNKSRNEHSNHKTSFTAQEASAAVESLLPKGSWQRVTVGVAAAAGGGLIAAAMVGVGPAALAGAAGYLAYRQLNGNKGNEQARSTGHKH